MKKLLWIKDSKEFWTVFGEEREKRRERLRKLPFAKKIEIVEKMKRMDVMKSPIRYPKGRVEVCS
jgi:hypothetical protein